MGKLGTFRLYKGKAKAGTRHRWRWTAIARNSKRVANGGEAYVNEADAVAGALRTAHIIAEANGYQLVKKG